MGMARVFVAAMHWLHYAKHPQVGFVGFTI